MIGKTILRLCTITGFFVISVFTFAYYRNSSSDVLVASSQSPDGVYLVKLFGTIGNFIPIGGTRINARIYKRGKAILKSIYFTSFDDDDFDKRYPQNAWIDNRTLRFNVKERRAGDDVDSIVIINKTEQPLTYLRVSALDCFLILDVRPKERIELNVPHYTWQSWIEAEGMYDGGRALRSKGVNFFHQDKLQKPLQYCILIGENELMIQSPSIEGWTINNPTIPASADGCDE